METIIVGFIGLSAAAYLLRRVFKAFDGKTGCSCSGGGCCGKQCFDKERRKN